MEKHPALSRVDSQDNRIWRHRRVSNCQDSPSRVVRITNLTGLELCEPEIRFRFLPAEQIAKSNEKDLERIVNNDPGHIYDLRHIAQPRLEVRLIGVLRYADRDTSDNSYSHPDQHLLLGELADKNNPEEKQHRCTHQEKSH